MPNELWWTNYSRFSIFAILNSEVTAPIFIKISHDVEAMRALTKRCRNAGAKSENGQFWRLQKGTKVNSLP